MRHRLGMPVLRLQRIAQIEVRCGMAGVDRKRRSIARYCFVEAIKRLQRTSQIVVRVGIVRPECKRLLYKGNALQRPSLLDMADSKQVQCDVIVWICFKNGLIQFLRFADSPRHVRFYRLVENHA
ncbi:MAG: hypothetical protein A3F75_10235 [Betaproteobacteria bacterium RIFCSPLOWO2_12_FULL_64_23]|nr:MAG: hypothetical protein A3F75_10235 [Betaproteobacteria bacterium RIFCSPLOWO2_12_FULL_64_23]